MNRLRHTCLAAALFFLVAAPPTPAAGEQLPACACDQLPATIFLGGLIDDYEAPADPAFRGWQLAAVSPGPWSAFDDPAIDRPFGFTFAKLPGDIVCARLEIRLRPVRSDSQNDALYFGALLGPPFLNWGIELGDLLPVGDSWEAGIDPPVFIFDLGNLPATGISPVATSMIANLNAERRLDIYVQDDTEVDYAKLTLRTFPSQQMSVGAADNLAPPTELTSIGPELSSAFPGALWKVLDDATPNRFLAHTFAPITSNVVQASLETQLQAHPDAPGDDTFNLGLVGGGPSFAFTAPLADLPTPGGTWNSGDPAATLLLDLGALPGSINLLPKINSDDRLDVMIEDDTQGDYFVLRTRSCPPPLVFDGFPFEPAGPADLNPTVNGGITVTTDGREGQGAGTILGSDGFSVVTAICLEDPGDDFELAVSGTVEQSSQPFARTAALSLLATGSASALSANFPNPYHVHLSTEVWKEGYRAASFTSPGTQGTVNGVIATVPAGVCFEELGFIDASCFRATLASPAVIQLVQGGPQILGDEIWVCRGAVAGSSFGARSAALTTTSATTFPILGAAIRAFGLFERVIGWAGVSADASGLTVYNLSPVGDEGLALLLGSAVSASVTLGDPAGSAAVGSYLEAEALGELGGVGGQSLGSLRFTKGAGGFAVIADYTPIASPSQRIQVLNGGTVVVDIPGHTGAIGASGWPSRIGYLGGRLAGYAASFPSGSVITVDGFPHAATELRLLAETSVVIGSKSELQLRAAGLSELRLAGAAATPNLVFQDGFESGGLDRWSFVLP